MRKDDANSPSLRVNCITMCARLTGTFHRHLAIGCACSCPPRTLGSVSRQVGRFHCPFGNSPVAELSGPNRLLDPSNHPRKALPSGLKRLFSDSASLRRLLPYFHSISSHLVQYAKTYVRLAVLLSWGLLLRPLLEVACRLAD